MHLLFKKISLFSSCGLLVKRGNQLSPLTIDLVFLLNQGEGMEVA
jgi:hypothetical protein